MLRSQKIGTVINGWRKQRGGHWFCRGQPRWNSWRASINRIREGDALVWGISVDGDDAFIPVAVLQDLLLQIETTEEEPNAS